MVSHSLSAGKITHFIILLFVASNRKCAVIIEKKYLYNYASVLGPVLHSTAERKVRFGSLWMIATPCFNCYFISNINNNINININNCNDNNNNNNNNNNNFILKHHACHLELITFYIIIRPCLKRTGNKQI